MRKIKLNVTYRVPSWNFCNLDGSGKVTKETCRFCVKTKIGYRCTLHDAALRNQDTLVDKCYQCIKATAGYAVGIDEPTTEGPVVDPKFIMQETLKLYNKTIASLMAQGYPRSMAETIATKYVLEDK